MKSRILYPASVAACVTLLALSAWAQATDTGAGTPKTSSNAATATVTGGASTATTHATKASAHHKAHSKHKHTAATTTGANQDLAYRAALKSCVTEQTAQRESCLDDTIARFDRS